MIVPEGSMIFNFAKVIESVTHDYSVIKKGNLAVTIKYSDNITITFFQGGNALFRGLDSKNAVLSIWKELQSKYMQ
jgi:hypothetical protein